MTSNQAECLSTSLGIPSSVDGLSCGASLAPSDADTDTVLIAHSDSSPAFVHRLRNAVIPLIVCAAQSHNPRNHTYVEIACRAIGLSCNVGSWTKFLSSLRPLVAWIPRPVVMIRQPADYYAEVDSF